MKKKVVNKLVVNWAASFLSVVILLSMVALPALAAVAANSVNSSSIVDGSILTRDIKRNAINSSRIRDYSIRKEDIHSGSINKYKLTSNSVNTFKIADGTIRNADIADGAINSAKIANGAIQDEDLSTKKGYLSIPPVAFSPSSDNTDYLKGTASLRLFSGAFGIFYVSVELPEGAVVTKLRYTAKDDNSGLDEYTNASLSRVSHSNQVEEGMALGSTAGLSSSPSWRTVVDSSVTNPTIDNNMYSYVARIYFSDPVDLWGGNVVIEYDYKR